MKKIAYILFIAHIAWACNPKNQSSEAETAEVKSQLGDMGYSFNISEKAKDAFDKGFLLLHSFEYDDAREEFRAAQEADPEEVMAYWGLAMTHYKALWGLQDLEKGRAVLAEFGNSTEERLAKISDPIEKAFWQGVEILYGEGELKERNQNYVDHLEDVYTAHPTNQEVAAFLSLGLMWADYKNEDYLKRSSDIASKILEANPTHPGALHYKIHANDNPKNAEEAIKAANKYAKVAPAAAHALHMPSHIYVALGMWNESVASNVDSYQASLDRIKRKEIDGTNRGYHSMAWLHYSYLQQGDFDQATVLLKEMMSYHQDSTHSDYYLINMQNQHLIESGAWPKDLAYIDVNYSKLGLSAKSAMHFFKSKLAFGNGDKSGIIENINELGAHAEAGKLLISDDGVALCSAGPTRYAPTKGGLKRTEVVILQMKAMLTLLNDDEATAEEHMLAATKLESECGYDPGPPFIAYPSYEQYGDWLLSKGRAEEALAQFNTCLEGRSNRANSLKGKLAALKKLGKETQAMEVEQLLSNFYQQSQFASL
jgi:tetratricopeptide (TPR) repeat protein